MDHRGNNASNWSVIQIFYNGQVFANTTELNTAFMDTTSGLNRQQVSSFSRGCMLTLEDAWDLGAPETELGAATGHGRCFQSFKPCYY